MNTQILKGYTIVSSNIAALFGLANLLPDSSMALMHSLHTVASIFILDSLFGAVTGYIFNSLTLSIINGFNWRLSFFPLTFEHLLSSSVKRTLVKWTAKLPTEQLFLFVESKKSRLKTSSGLYVKNNYYQSN